MSDQVVVLVPTLGRPAAVERMVKMFADSNTPGRMLFLCSAEDDRTIDECELFNVDTIVMRPSQGTWPIKINHGIAWTTEPWILCAADDVTLHRNWFQATYNHRKHPDVGVIATNDLHNPLVLAGHHATHPLVRRAYVEDYGTIDGPGKLLHEGYRHNYSDNEVSQTAIARGMFTFCADAVVEHHHPAWTGGATDATYQRNELALAHDEALWHARYPRIQRLESATTSS